MGYYTTYNSSDDMLKFLKLDISEMPKKKILCGTAFMAAIFLAGLLVLAYNANSILKYELQQFFGKGFSADNISLRWGSVKAKGIRLLRPDNKEAFSAEDLELRANLLGLLRQENVISDVTLDSPLLFIEIDSNGRVIFPWPPRNRDSAKAVAKGKPADKAAAPFLIKKLEIKDGALNYLDRKVSTAPVLIQLKELDAALRNVSMPPDNRISSYKLKAAVAGMTKNGSISSVGAVNFMTKDTKAQLTIRDLDLTLLRPYYEKKGDVEVTRGLLSLDAEIAIRNNKISSTGKFTIRELTFKQSGGRFLGLPLLAAMQLLKDSKNQIVLDFTIEGDLKNPKFNITESLVQKLSLSLAKSLGMPIEAIGKSVLDLGGSALKKLFK